VCGVVAVRLWPNIHSPVVVVPGGDYVDLRGYALLLDRLNVRTAAGVWVMVARYFSIEAIAERSQLLIENLIA
jgi:hypothetical protein